MSLKIRHKKTNEEFQENLLVNPENISEKNSKKGQKSSKITRKSSLLFLKFYLPFLGRIHSLVESLEHLVTNHNSIFFSMKLEFFLLKKKYAEFTITRTCFDADIFVKSWFIKLPLLVLQLVARVGTSDALNSNLTNEFF